MGVSVYAAGFDTFTATGVKGDVVVALPAVKGENPAQKGNAYPAGTRVETGVSSSLDAMLSDKNVFTVEPETAVQMIQTSQEDKASAVCLVLGLGKVSVDLADYPQDVGFQVKSPLGRYTVVGTEFTVSYATESPAREIGVLTVVRGEVVYEGDDLEAAAVTAGGELVVVRERGKDSTYYEVTANGRPVLLTVSDRHRVALSANSTVRIGVDDVHSGSFIAIAVTAGSARVGDQTLGPAGGAVFVRQDTIVDQEGAAEYLSAVEQSATTYSQMQQGGLTDEEISQLNQAYQDAQSIVDEGANGVLDQVFRPPYVITPIGPPAIEPQSPSGASLPPSTQPPGGGKKWKRNPCETICRPVVEEPPSICGICVVPTKRTADSGICGVCTR
jgi:hypothetical protein